MDSMEENILLNYKIPQYVLFKIPNKTTNNYFYDKEKPELLIFGPIKINKQIETLRIKNDLLDEIKAPNIIERCEVISKRYSIFSLKKLFFAVYKNLEKRYPTSWSQIENKKHLKIDQLYLSTDERISLNFYKNLHQSLINVDFLESLAFLWIIGYDANIVIKEYTYVDYNNNLKILIPPTNFYCENKSNDLFLKKKFDFFTEKQYIEVSEKLKEKLTILSSNILLLDVNLKEKIIDKFTHILKYFNKDIEIPSIYNFCNQKFLESETQKQIKSKDKYNSVFLDFLNNSSKVENYLVPCGLNNSSSKVENYIIKNEIPSELSYNIGYTKLKSTFDNCITYHGLPAHIVINKLLFHIRRGETKSAIIAASEIYSICMVRKNTLDSIFGILLHFTYTEITPIEMEYVNTFSFLYYFFHMKNVIIDLKDDLITLISLVQLLSDAPKSNLVLCSMKVYNDPNLIKEIGLSVDFECEYEDLKTFYYKDLWKKLKYTDQSESFFEDENLTNLLANFMTYLKMKDFEVIRILGIIDKKYGGTTRLFGNKKKSVNQYIWESCTSVPFHKNYHNLGKSMLPIYHLCINKLLNLKNHLSDVKNYSLVMSKLKDTWSESPLIDQLLNYNYEMNISQSMTDKNLKEFYILKNIDTYSYNHKLQKISFLDL